MAHIVRDGELIAEVLYVKNWIIDAIACVLAVVGFFLPFAVMVAFFEFLPEFVQRLLNPLHPGAVPGWAWGVAMIVLAGFAYLLALLVLLWARSRIRIEVTANAGEEDLAINIFEQRASWPWKVKAKVLIAGQEIGAMHGRGRSFLNFCGKSGGAVEFASTEHREPNRETVLSSLLVLIGMVFSVVVAPARQRTHQRWSIHQAGRSLGRIDYHRLVVEHYRVLLNRGAEDNNLAILAGVLFLARPASSGNLESHEEIHQHDERRE